MCCDLYWTDSASSQVWNLQPTRSHHIEDSEAGILRGSLAN